MVNVHSLIFNDMVSQVYLAAKVCVRGKIAIEEEKRIKTISNSVGCGHESLLEHTNLITIIEKDSKDTDIQELTKFLETLKYLNYRIYYKDTKMFIIISGSIRGYKHIIRNIVDLNNKYVEYIKESLYRTPKYFYKDFIEDEILNEKEFVKFSCINNKNKIFINENNEAESTEFEDKPITTLISKDKKPNILFMDDIRVLAEEISRITKLDINLDDLLDFCSMTILFTISRTAANQLVRHRNAISQESQRYVSYENTPFINPLDDIESEDGRLVTVKKIINKRAESAISDYSFLLRNYPDLVKKEDARSILPANMETVVLMTFTYKSLIQAIELRTSKAAQREIRNNFLYLEEKLKSILFGSKIKCEDDLKLYVWSTKNHFYRSNSSFSIDYLNFIDNENITDELTDQNGEVITEERKEELKQMASEYAKAVLDWEPDYSTNMNKTDNFIEPNKEYDNI